MPNDPQWLMGALAASDAYRGDEPAVAAGADGITGRGEPVG